MSLELFKHQLKNAKIVKRGNYKYIINAICEQEPPLDPSILEDCADKLLSKINWKEANKILTPEAMGIHIATAVSLKTRLPLIIATRRKKFTLDEISVDYVTGYDKGILYINGIEKGDRILIIDDLISTGGTTISLIKAIKDLGAKVIDVGVIFNKVDYGGIKELIKMGFNPKYLLTVKLKGEKIEVEEA